MTAGFISPGRNLGGRGGFLALLLGILPLAACGNSAPSHPAARSSAPAAASPQPSTPTATATAVPTGSTAAPSEPPNSGPLLPAAYTIVAGGRLTPSSVGGPAGVAVRLTIRSGDGRSHLVRVQTPQSHVLQVPAGGAASIRLTGLPRGHYPIEVDGLRRGTLVIGIQPGP